MNSQSHVINILREEAQKSQILQQLAAAVTKGGKMVGKPYCNSPRNRCHGDTFGSLHAEARAIITYFGRSLQFVPKFGWRLLRNYAEKSKT